MKNTGTAGNYGKEVRSDCRISIALKEKGGITLDIKSKVASMYGESIRSLILNILEFYDIKHADLRCEDSGALPYVLAARTEAAIKCISNSKKEYLLPSLENTSAGSGRERYRITRLYLPGNSPSMIVNAAIHKPDGIILDLEDAVAPEKKDEARILVRNALRNIDFLDSERMVRINQLPLGLEDAAVLSPHKVDLFILPKCEESWQVKKLEELVMTSLEHEGLKRQVFYMPIIESALGIENAFHIAKASKNVVAMAIGLEDYTADIGVVRTAEGSESLYARTRLINACKAAGIQPIDSVYSDLADITGLQENVARSRSLGFEGMGCIHPAQIKIIHDGFKPSPDEIEKAQKIVAAFKEAQKKGLGLVSLGSKMIDAPVVKRAKQTLELAKKFNLIW